MAFKLSKKKDSVRLQCTAVIPNDRGGEIQHKFFASFRVPSPSDRQAMTEDARAQALNFREVIPQWLVGWDQIYDENDEPLAFNEENVDIVIENLYLLDAMTVTFSEFLFDRGKARRKN